MYMSCYIVFAICSETSPNPPSLVVASAGQLLDWSIILVCQLWGGPFANTCASIPCQKCRAYLNTSAMHTSNVFFHVQLILTCSRSVYTLVGSVGASVCLCVMLASQHKDPGGAGPSKQSF